MRSIKHGNHILLSESHNNCPECRADNSRRFARTQKFSHTAVPVDARRKYLAYLTARLEAIRTGLNGGNTVSAVQWYRWDFLPALHKRISSHIPNQSGRKYAPEYAKYHLATYGNDWHYLNT